MPDQEFAEVNELFTSPTRPTVREVIAFLQRFPMDSVVHVYEEKWSGIVVDPADTTDQ